MINKLKFNFIIFIKSTIFTQLLIIFFLIIYPNKIIEKNKILI